MFSLEYLLTVSPPTLSLTQRRLSPIGPIPFNITQQDPHSKLNSRFFHNLYHNPLFSVLKLASAADVLSPRSDITENRAPMFPWHIWTFLLRRSARNTIAILIIYIAYDMLEMSGVSLLRKYLG